VVDQPEEKNTVYNDKKCDLDDCLKYYFRQEILESSKCRHCKNESKKTKQFKLANLPKVLIFAFKRFDYSSRGMLFKIDTHVNFPFFINLSNYTSSKPNPNIPTINKSAYYKLISVVCHHGRSVQSGHYTTFCYNSQKDQWYHFDDNKVEVASINDIESCQCYILFYESIEKEDFIRLGGEENNIEVSKEKIEKEKVVKKKKKIIGK